MATTTDLTTLKINYLSQAQYDNALANNQINPNELYFTPADNGVTLNVNGQSTSSPSFYAPTDSGTADTQALVSGGTATAPKWVDISPSITVTAGTSNATPKVNVTVLGQSGTAQSITQATTGIYGATKLTNTYTSTDETLATTGKSILAAIQTLDVTAITGAANKTITSISETDGKISATYSDIGSLNASTITSGTLPTARGGTGTTSYRINSVIVGSATPTETGGTVASQLTWISSKSGALYSTGTNLTPQFGTLPVAQGGTGNTSYTASRMIYSESAAKLSASGHYASSDKIAINSTSIPNENLYVNGTSRFSLGSQPNDKTTDKKFIIGSSGSRYLSFGGAGIQAYDASNNASTLYLNYYGGNLIVGQNGYNGRVILDTTTAASNSTTPSLRVMQNAQITSTDVNHMAQFLASNMETGGANAIVLGKAVSANQAGGLLYTQGGDTTASSLSFGFVNNLGLLKITSSGSIYVNSGSSNTHNTNTSELLVKGRVVVDTSYHNTNSFSEFRINRSTGGWSAITLGGAQGTVSGAGLGVWLIGNKDTPANATTAAASITDSQFYISYNGSNSAACRIQGHNATGFSIRPRLAVNTDVNTSYNFYVNGTAAISDTLYLTRTTDASGTADNKPALMIGSSTGQHIEIDGNEILSKSNTTTPGTLYLQDDTGSVAVAGSGGLTVSSLTASQAVSTDANKKLVSTNLSVSDPSASGSGITYIATISQSATGKITATKSTVRDASTSQSGIVSTGTQQFKGRKGFGYLNLYAEDAGTAKRYIDIIGYNNAGTQIAEIYYDAGNTTNITTGIWRFKEFSPHSTADTTTTGFYEYYSLPVVAKDLTANQGYNILTSKSAVTIAQGGTGATTRLAAAKNLTSENVTSPDYVVSLTQSWANFGYTSIANLKTTLGINAGSMVQSQYLVREGTGTTSYSMTFNFAPDIIISLTSGSTDFMIDSYQGILVSGAYNFNNNIVFMRFVPTGTYQSALSNTAEDYTTGDFFSGIQFAPPMIKSGLFANYFPYYVNNGTFTFNPNENSGGVLHQKSSNGKTYYLKAVSNTTGVAYAQTILNSSGVKYAFLALKFM